MSQTEKLSERKVMFEVGDLVTWNPDHPDYGHKKDAHSEGPFVVSYISSAGKRGDRVAHLNTEAGVNIGQFSFLAITPYTA
ncbi:MAG: hypothetical protein HGA38_03645 [Candidatus Moranbacteria bacterium]|nr:hypothetical protein [Candidatus Moranbacteria bacterium]NTW45796.1 hypothetical protein [Candidatus Moranbacteria bacterium]